MLDDLKPDTAVVGASGQVSIFTRQATGEWQLTAQLLDPFAPLPRPYYNSNFGYLASLDDSMLAVAATPEDKPAPVIYLFTRNQGQWSLLQTIDLSRSFGDVYLKKMLVSGGTLAVSQIEYATDTSGRTETKVLVFSRNNIRGGGARFQLQQKLDPASNPDPDAAYSIALEAQTLVLATPGSGDTVGAVYLYRNNDATEHHFSPWRLKQIIQPRNLNATSGFGSTISLSGNTLAVAAPGDASPPPTLYPGAVYIYRQQGERWRLKDRIVDPVTESDPPSEFNSPPAENPFATLIALSGNRLLVRHITNAYGSYSMGILFERQQGNWTPVARLGDTSASGNTVVEDLLMTGATAWIAETPFSVFSPTLNIYDLPALTIGAAEPASEP